MESEWTVSNLSEVKTLAHTLYTLCRESPSSYKLLAPSVRKLRNDLEDVEELLETSRTPGPGDSALPDQIARSRELLEQLNLSLQRYQHYLDDDVSETAVADFKTALDVAEQELAGILGAISANDIELKPGSNAWSILRSPSTPHESASTSLVETAPLGGSSRTSSSSSLRHQQSPNKVSVPDAIDSHVERTLDSHPSEDKEVVSPDTTYLPTPGASSAVTEGASPSGWRSPFASPDPMSISIEQASSMILNDDGPSILGVARELRSIGPSPVLDTHTDNSEIQQEPPRSAGLYTVRNNQSSNETRQSSMITAQDAVRPRALSESVQPLDRAPILRPNEPGQVQTFEDTQDYESSGTFGTHRLLGPRNDSLGPIAAARESGHRGRNHSSSSSTFSTRPVETREAAVDEESERNIRSYQNDLGVVLESSPTASDEAFSSTSLNTPPAPDTVSSARERTADETGTPPKPIRKPPPPPVPRKKPKIPSKSPTYRVVNATSPDDDSSDEEDLSSSKSTSPVVPKKPLELRLGGMRTTRSSSVDGIEVSNSETDAISERRLDRDRVIQAHRILEARAAYSPQERFGAARSYPNITSSRLPIIAPSLSTQSLRSGKNPEESSPPLKRHSTSAGLPYNHRRSFSTGKLIAESPDEPPPVPERPPRGWYHNRSVSFENRPTRASMGPIPVALEEPVYTTDKELVPEPEAGLEVNNMLTAPPLNTRVSADAALNVRNSTVSTQAPNVLESESSTSPEVVMDSTDPEVASLAGFYTPGNDSTETSELDRERINHIVHFWNEYDWDQAELYLTAYLESLIEQNALAHARRIRHLLGVCASFKGRWSKAIPLFLSVLRSPIIDIFDIDDGDCAAAYWLGDAYSLLNQRTEALLAYCIAERSSVFGSPTEPNLRELVSIEQEAVQLGESKTGFAARWAQETFSNSASGVQSIIDTNIITKAAVDHLLENEPRKTPKKDGGSSSHREREQYISRATSLSSLSRQIGSLNYYRTKLSPASFEPDTAWPMAFDPFFAMANVRHGRLSANEGDLLTALQNSTEGKLLKSVPMSLNRTDWSTSMDLKWLIGTVRDCLRMLEMEWSEIMDGEGAKFAVRYTFLLEKLATTYYFSITLYRHSFRSGYVAEICPDGICSARIIRSGIEYSKGVHQSESKRIKKLIQESLEEASKQQVRNKKKDASVSPGPNDAVTTPTIPPRPR